jgi:hypothetical protein
MSRELVFEPSGERSQDFMIGACKFPTLCGGVGNTGGTLAYIFATNDEKGVLEIVYFDRAGSDTTLVDQWCGTTRTSYSVEYEWLWIPIQETML